MKKMAKEINELRNHIIERGGRVEEYDDYQLESIINGMISARNNKTETNNLIKVYPCGWPFYSGAALQWGGGNGSTILLCGQR